MKPDSMQDMAETMADVVRDSSDLLNRYSRRRPIFGGVFGAGEFSLCSFATIHNGLDSVEYMVAHSESGYPLSLRMKLSKAEALSLAREFLVGPNRQRVMTLFAMAHEVQKKMERDAEQRRRDQELDDRRHKKHSVQSISHRRRSVFEKSGGVCFYCKCELTIDGKWHIEHKMPKALGGGNEPGNLVASCAPCNFRKRDRTAEEFISGRTAEVSA